VGSSGDVGPFTLNWGMHPIKTHMFLKLGGKTT